MSQRPFGVRCGLTRKQQPLTPQIGINGSSSTLQKNENENNSSHLNMLLLFGHPIFQQATRKLISLVYMCEDPGEQQVTLVQFLEITLRVQKALTPKFRLTTALRDSLRIWISENNLLMSASHTNSTHPANASLSNRANKQEYSTSDKSSKSSNNNNNNSSSIPLDLEEECKSLNDTSMSGSFSASQLREIIANNFSGSAILKETKRVGVVVIQKYLMDIASTMCSNHSDIELLGVILNTILVHITSKYSLKSCEDIPPIPPNILKQFHSMRLFYAQHVRETLLHNQALWRDWNYIRHEDILANIEKKLNGFFEGESERLMEFLPKPPFTPQYSFLPPESQQQQQQSSSQRDMFESEEDKIRQLSKHPNKSHTNKSHKSIYFQDEVEQNGEGYKSERQSTAILTKRENSSAHDRDTLSLYKDNEYSENSSNTNVLNFMSKQPLLRSLEKRILASKKLAIDAESEMTDRSWIKQWMSVTNEPNNKFLKLLRMKMSTLQKPRNSPLGKHTQPQKQQVQYSSLHQKKSLKQQQQLQQQQQQQQQSLPQQNYLYPEKVTLQSIVSSQQGQQQQLRPLTSNASLSTPKERQYSRYETDFDDLSAMDSLRGQKRPITTACVSTLPQDFSDTINSAYQPQADNINNNNNNNSLNANKANDISPFLRSRSWSNKEKRSNLFQNNSNTLIGNSNQIGGCGSSHSNYSINELRDSSQNGSRNQGRRKSNENSTPVVVASVKIDLSTSKNDILAVNDRCNDYSSARNTRRTITSAGVMETLFKNQKLAEQLCGGNSFTAYQPTSTKEDYYSICGFGRPNNSSLSSSNNTSSTTSPKKRKSTSSGARVNFESGTGTAGTEKTVVGIVGGAVWSNQMSPSKAADNNNPDKLVNTSRFLWQKYFAQDKQQEVKTNDRVSQLVHELKVNKITKEPSSVTSGSDQKVIVSVNVTTVTPQISPQKQQRNKTKVSTITSQIVY